LRFVLFGENLGNYHSNQRHVDVLHKPPIGPCCIEVDD
jgi:hypothetical protein